jgi:putative zinc finger/helix-turn-helix YgiT family protein
MSSFECDRCGTGVATHIIEKEQEFPVKGEPIRVLSSVRVCDACGEEIFDRGLDSANLLAAYDVYRQRHDLMTPSDIRSLRNRYGLSQRSLGTLLGWGEVTIHRYERGSLPDEAHNQVLQFLMHPDNMARVLKSKGDRLAQHARRTLEKRLKEILAGEAPLKAMS